MPVHLGGPTARKVIPRGDMACAFHYINEDETACFYSLTRRDLKGKTFGAYCIPLESAWMYAEPRYLFEAACKAAQIMGYDPNSKHEVHKIMDFMQDMLIELCTMKPMPDELAQKQAPMEVSVRDGKVNVVIH